MTSASLDAVVNAAAGAGAGTGAKVRVRCFFKAEMMQRTGSFKFRGASNAVAMLPPLTECVATVSSGNFAQALALAAKEKALRCVVVMPRDTTSVKVQAVRGFGAEVVFCDPDKRDETLLEVVKGLGPRAVAVHPSDDPCVIAGQGTVFTEFDEQVRELTHGEGLDVIVVPVGGGGVIAGVAVAASLANRTVVVGAEPRIADDAWRSLRAGSVRGHRNGQVPRTVAEGLRTTLGPNTLAAMRGGAVREIFLVDEDAIVASTRLLMERLKLVVEPSSATTFAALRDAATLEWLAANVVGERHRDRPLNVGLVLTGGNVDVSPLFPLTKL